MSQVFVVHGAILGGIISMVIGNSLGYQEPAVYLIAIIGGVLGMLAWHYSPLPNMTRGPM